MFPLSSAVDWMPFEAGGVRSEERRSRADVGPTGDGGDTAEEVDASDGDAGGMPSL